MPQRQQLKFRQCPTSLLPVSAVSSLEPTGALGLWCLHPGVGRQCWQVQHRPTSADLTTHVPERMFLAIAISSLQAGASPAALSVWRVVRHLAVVVVVPKGLVFHHAVQSSSICSPYNSSKRQLPRNHQLVSFSETKILPRSSESHHRMFVIDETGNGQQSATCVVYWCHCCLRTQKSYNDFLFITLGSAVPRPQVLLVQSWGPIRTPFP